MAPFPASFGDLMAEPETDPVLDIGERSTRRIHESRCEYTRVEAVFGRTAAHNVGKGHREPATACGRIFPWVDQGSGHTTTHLLSRRQSPILRLHAVSLGATSHRSGSRVGRQQQSHIIPNAQRRRYTELLIKFDHTCFGFTTQPYRLHTLKISSSHKPSVTIIFHTQCTAREGAFFQTTRHILSPVQRNLTLSKQSVQVRW